MDSARLGVSALPVSRLGIGLAALGRPGYINLGHAGDLRGDYEIAAMEAHAHAVLDAAWQGGVRYIDAARSYGRAEEFLASWLHGRQVAPEAATIGSKWGYTYTACWQVTADRHEVKDLSIETLERQLAESRALLGRHLDLYQIHSATVESGVLENRAVLARLARLRAEGVAIGLTVTGTNQSDTVRRAVAVQLDDQRLFDTVQATWNLLEPSAGPALRAAHDAGLGVIVKEPLANGRLTARNRDPAFAASRQRLESVATRLGGTLDAAALAAALAQPWIDVVLSGAATTAQLASNLRALDLTWDDDATAAVTSIVETPEQYWKKRNQLAWN